MDTTHCQGCLSANYLAHWKICKGTRAWLCLREIQPLPGFEPRTLRFESAVFQTSGFWVQIRRVKLTVLRFTKFDHKWISKSFIFEMILRIVQQTESGEHIPSRPQNLAFMALLGGTIGHWGGERGKEANKYCIRMSRAIGNPASLPGWRK